MDLEVLHIEDNLSDAELVKIELEMFFPSINLHQVYNKLDFIKLLNEKKFDLIISDYNLPDFEGMEIFKTVENSSQNIPFIFVSGTIGEERAVEVLRSGVTDYVLKENLAKLPIAIKRAINEVNQKKEKLAAENALKESENFKSSILNSLSAHIAVLNYTGKIIATNDNWNKFASQYKIDTTNLESINYFVFLTHFLSGKEAKILYSGILDVIHNKTSYFYLDYSIKQFGEKKWYTLRVNQLSHSKEVVVSHINITDRKKAEFLLKESEERFRGLIENSSEITFIINEFGHILFISPSIKKITGYSVKELLNQEVFQYFHPRDRKKLIDSFSIKKKQIIKGEYNIYEFKCNDGNYKHLRLMLTNHSNTPSINGFIINAQDISDLIKSEKEKHFAIIKTEEKERLRISNDLHDGLGQTIAAANMCVNTLDNILKNQLDENTYSIFKTAKNLINESAKETRLVSHSIMPRSLKEFGLFSCINGILKSYHDFYTKISFEINSNAQQVRFEEEIELALYRVAQEAINNAVKHSNASKVTISLNQIRGKLDMKISDNGIGFEKNKLVKKGIGLESIEQRIKAIDGKVSINSIKSHGTTVNVKVKVKQFESISQ